ncbi:MAG: winged helix-turn-helix domain-containing protein [Candidatus Bathyarchaeia archaeon]|nr:winged helix-turn-helix domain-containing protein [Candidatus Bathyarchaeota archaeon]
MVQKEKEVTVGHRGRFDIIANILNSSLNGAKKTQLMYKCNLSFKQLGTYLSFLLDKKLLNGKLSRQSRESILYITTEKGLSFLKAYRTLNALLTA